MAVDKGIKKLNAECQYDVMLSMAVYLKGNARPVFGLCECSSGSGTANLFLLPYEMRWGEWVWARK
jgi:hypothetical protein